MIQRKGQIINSHSGASTYQDLTSTRPWLDDMIGRANEVLNALLRLRKHQIASEQLRSAAANTSDHYHVK
jgi:vacuolar-type H+-ATPase subunit D/Vma8